MTDLNPLPEHEHEHHKLTSGVDVGWMSLAILAVKVYGGAAIDSVTRAAKRMRGRS